MTTTHTPPYPVAPPRNGSPGANSAGPTPPDPPAPATGAAAVWRAKWWILLAAVVAAAGAVAIGLFVVPERYEAHASVRVVAYASDGALEGSVLASNELASQYAQLASSGPVLDLAAQRPGIGGLGDSVSAGTVGDRNLISITARAGNADSAATRANAVADALIQYLRRAGREQAVRYGRLVQTRLAPIDRQITEAREELAAALRRLAQVAPQTQAAASLQASMASSQALLATLVAQREQVAGQLARNAIAGEPDVTVFETAGPGDRTQPKPVLYGIVAFLAMVLIASQVAVLARRVRTPPAA